MKLNIEPKLIVLKPQVEQTFTELSYVVTYDNTFDNSKLGLPNGMCKVTFAGGSPAQPSLEAITILGTADWNDEQVNAEICKRLGVTLTK